MARRSHVDQQSDGTGLLSLETLVNMPTPITLIIDGVEWEVLRWDSGWDALRLKPAAVYRYFSQSRNDDGSHSLEWRPARGHRGAPVIRRVSFDQLARLEAGTCQRF
jgi:hypothetical protein